MGVLAKIGSEVKTLANLKSLGFSAYGGNAYSGSYGGTMPGYGFYLNTQLPGSQYDDKTAAGVLWENPAAAACFVALTKAFAQARPYLEKRVKPDSDDWEREDHRLIELLERPNEDFSGEKLFGVTLISAMANGAAFWYFERDGKGDVAEIWYEPPIGLGPTGIAPNWDKETFIKNYIRVVDGQRQELDKKDVVYFRHGLNVTNPRMPWAPLGLGAREIATLNGASTYTAAVVRNHGVPAGFVSLDGQGVNSEDLTEEQARAFKAQVEATFTGPQNAGRISISNFPFKWNKIGMTPADLVIDQIRQWPQGVVCALLGTPPDVALLPNSEGRATYENLDASMEWWWKNTVIPLEDAFADEIETQMFPAFDLDPAEYRIAWDRSKVPALQEDEEAKHRMLDASYKAGWMKRSEVRHLAGLESKPEDEVYISEAGGVMEPNEDEGQARVDAALAAAKSYDPNQPRDDDGKWTSGGGGSHNSGMTPADKIRQLEEKYSQADAKERAYWQANRKEIAKEQKEYDKGNIKERPLFAEYLRLGQESTAAKKELQLAKEEEARAKTEAKPEAAGALREVVTYATNRTPNTVLVARFSDDIDADLKRGWSGYQTGVYGSTRAEVERYAKEEGFKDPDIRKMPEGGYALVHHDGLSVYPLDSESVDGAHQEAVGNAAFDGSGYGHATIGRVRKMRTIPKELIGSLRDLHILEVEETEHEQMTPMPWIPKMPKPEDETKALTDEEIEELTDDLTPEDLQAAIGSRTPAMQALLRAKDGK